MTSTLTSDQVSNYYSQFFNKTEAEVFADDHSGHVNSRTTSRFKAPVSENEIISLEFNTTGTVLAYSRIDGSLNIWKLRMDKPDVYSTISDAHGPEKLVNSISWNPSEEYQFATVGNTNSVKIWESLSGALVRTINTDLKMKNYRCSYDPTGKWLIVLTKSDSLYLFDVIKGYVLHSVSNLHQDAPTGSDTVHSIAWDNTGLLFFAGFKSGKIVVFQMTEENGLVQSLEIKDHLGAINRMKCDSYGKYLIVGSDDTSCSVWNIKDMCCAWVICDFDDCIIDLDICHNGYALAVCSESATRIYALSNGVQIFEKLSKNVNSHMKFRFYPRKTWFISSIKNDILKKFYVPKTFNPMILCEREENKRRAEKKVVTTLTIKAVAGKNRTRLAIDITMASPQGDDNSSSSKLGFIYKTMYTNDKS